MNISVFNAISDAIAFTKQLLIDQFSFSRWFFFGIAAFLATLGENNISFSNFNFSSHQHNTSQFKQFVVEYLPVIIVIAAFIILFLLALSILFVWLSSRGKFIFLDGIVRNQPDIIRPWHEFSTEGTSLFIFRLIVGFISLGIIVCIVGAILIICLPIFHSEPFSSARIVLLLLCILLFLAFLMPLILFNSILTDFIVPIMYRCRIGVLRALVVFKDKILSGHVVDLIVFYVMKILLSIVITICCVLITLLTCCACCMLVFPFLNMFVAAMIFLPFIMFMRCYSLFFLQQFGDDWFFIDMQHGAYMPDSSCSAEIMPETI